MLIHWRNKTIFEGVFITIFSPSIIHVYSTTKGPERGCLKINTLHVYPCPGTPIIKTHKFGSGYVAANWHKLKITADQFEDMYDIKLSQSTFRGI